MELTAQIEEFAGTVREFRKRFEEKSARDNARIDALETVLGRPPMAGMASRTDEWTEEMKSFDYMVRGKDYEKKTLTVASDPSFGFACPAQMATEIYHALTEGNPLRSLARHYETDKNSLEILKKSASGAVVLQASEVSEIAETAGLAYEKLTYTPATEVYMLKQSLIHMEDTAFPIDQEISMELGEAFGTYEAAAHVAVLIANVGDGTLNTYNHTHAGSTTVITGDNLINLTYAIPTRYLAGARFIMNRTTMAYIRTLKDAVTGAYLWQSLLTGSDRDTLCGYPVTLVDDMPAMTSALYPIGFGNWNKALAIVDHSRGFQLQRLAERFAEYGIVAFLSRFRTISGPLDGAAVHFLQMST